MSDIDLRPLTFGEILDGAFKLYRRHFLTLFLTALIAMIPVTLLMGVVNRSGAAMEGGAGGEYLAMMVPSFLLSMVVLALLWAALTQQTAAALEGDEVSLGSGYSRGAKALLPLMGAGIVSFLAVVALMLVMMVVMVVAVIVLGDIGGAVISVVAGIGGAFAMVVALVALFAIVPAIVLEGRGPIAAIRRSWQLSRGGRLKILGLVIVTSLIVMLPSLGLGMVVGLGEAMWDTAEAVSLSPTQLVLQDVIGILSGSLTTPFMVASMTLLYFDRRVRSEGYDLEVATDALTASA